MFKNEICIFDFGIYDMFCTDGVFEKEKVWEAQKIMVQYLDDIHEWFGHPILYILLYFLTLILMNLESRKLHPNCRILDLF